MAKAKDSNKRTTRELTAHSLRIRLGEPLVEILAKVKEFEQEQAALSKQAAVLRKKLKAIHFAIERFDKTAERLAERAEFSMDNSDPLGELLYDEGFPHDDRALDDSDPINLHLPADAYGKFMRKMFPA